MKSQHRHDLQTNELGKVADKVATSFGGFFEAYGNLVMIGFCVVALIAAAVIIKVRVDHGKDAAAWSAFAAAKNPEEYKRVAADHPGTGAAIWARDKEAEGRLAEGTRLLFTQVESGRTELQEARTVFQELLNQSGTPAEIRERALFGLARCVEALSDGGQSDAVKAYQDLLREFPTTVYKKDAEKRIAVLEKGSGQEFYAWFAKFERPKAEERLPRDPLGKSASDLESPFADDKDIPDNPAAPSDTPLDAPASDEANPQPPEATENSEDKPSLPKLSTPDEADGEKPPAEPKAP